MSGLPNFSTQSSFATIECSMYASLCYSLVEFSSMFCGPLFDDDDTFALISSPNKTIDSSIQHFKNKDNFPPDKNYMSIPRNLCLFTLDTVKLPKCLAIVSITFVFTS